MLTHHLDGSNPSTGRNHWASFEKYVVLQISQGSINTYDELKNMFALMLTDIAQNWFEPIMNVIQDMVSIKEKCMRYFNSQRQTLW